MDIFAVHIDQREETINLNGISGALMATTNLQMQTFVAGGMRKFESAEKEECLCLNDQGGERMDVSVDVTATLRAGMSGHPPPTSMACRARCLALTSPLRRCLQWALRL